MATSAHQGDGEGTPQQGDTVSVADGIRALMPEVSPAERRVARALLAKYPTAGLESTSALAEIARASPPTVVRFVSKLGFGGYREFQQQLRDEVQQRRASPLTLQPRLVQESPSSALRDVSIEVFEGEIAKSLTVVPLGAVDSALDLLANKRRPVTAIGGRFSYLMAEYLDLHLRVMRPGSAAHRPSPHRDGPLILDAGRRDVFVVFDFRRYQEDVINLAKELHKRGSQIILVTDPWLSPVAEVAQVVLPVRVEGPSPFDSLVPATALVEMLVAGLLAKLGTSAEERIRKADEIANDTTVP